MIYPFLYHNYFFKLMYHEKDWKKEYYNYEITHVVCSY